MSRHMILVVSKVKVGESQLKIYVNDYGFSAILKGDV